MDRIMIYAMILSTSYHGSLAQSTAPTTPTDEGCTHGDLRLEGPRSTDTEGRVEICINGEWGTVCDDSWGVSDANVVCGQLGFLNFTSLAFDRASYGQGTGNIWLDGVACSGSESRLIDCPGNPVGMHNCRHSEDAGVQCFLECSRSDGKLRLEEGCNSLEGRVEICANRGWGTVCDDAWGVQDAAVVCRQLGFSDTGAIPISFGAFGPGTGPIWLDEVQCLGNESRLIDCPANPLGVHNCARLEAAGVRCKGPAPDCIEGDLRLDGGSTIYEGRVEICINREWGTVCDDSWDILDANVVCGQLGFSNIDAVPRQRAAFGRGCGIDILLDEVGCSGNESILLDCPANPVGDHDCSHSQDAGVQCAMSACSDGDLRLVGGSNISEGRVEICVDEDWGTVCDNGSWGNEDANVVCTQLGFASTGAITVLNSYVQFGMGSGDILLGEVGCSGNESRLFDCPANPVGIRNCTHTEDAGVVCDVSVSPTPCDHGEVRLIGGCDASEGRVEVCIYGLWGAVCSNTWRNTEAGVVCAQLGLPSSGAVGFSASQYGQGGLPILIDGVECAGNEEGLLNCSTGPFGIHGHDCNHATEVGVACSPAGCHEGAVRLVGGAFFYEGGVEICVDGVWGTVCDDNWGILDANVVCRRLGFVGSGAESFESAYFGKGCGSIALDDLDCMGDELHPQACSRLENSRNRNCGHHKDAGVRCARTDIVFFPFGPYAGDITGPDDDEDSILGPIQLQVPLIYYLRHQYQLHVSQDGVIFLSEDLELSMASTPHIVPSWSISSTKPGSDLITYVGVSQEPLVLGRVKEMVTDQNPDLSNFEPSLAVIITWHNNVSVEIGTTETLQAVLSTDGQASFAHFLFDDGESVRALAADGVMMFSAGDGQRLSTSSSGSINSQALRDSLSSFRIDGHCITELIPDSVCELNSYSVVCAKGTLHASTCRCYQTTDSGTKDMLNVSPMPTDISCVSGSVLTTHPLAEGSEFTGCYPILLPCYISDTCPWASDSGALNCASSEFMLFGEGAGDTLGPREDDGVTGSISLSVPVVYFGIEHHSFYVSTNGLVSFEDSYVASTPCDPPCTPVPIIAPGWRDWTLQDKGSLYYRVTQDQVTLDLVAGMITDMNLGLSDYQPTLAVIVTWFEVRLANNQSGSVVDTFQTVISTDGQHSFTALIYNNLTFSSINNYIIIGFDSAREEHADIQRILLLNNQILEAANIYRIDGSCVTSVLPGQVCGLEAVATECGTSQLTATFCTCGEGYERQGMDCVAKHNTLYVSTSSSTTAAIANVMVILILAFIAAVVIVVSSPFQDVLWLWWGVQYNLWKNIGTSKICSHQTVQGSAMRRVKDDPCGTPVECYGQAINALEEAEQKILVSGLDCRTLTKL